MPILRLQATVLLLFAVLTGPSPAKGAGACDYKETWELSYCWADEAEERRQREQQDNAEQQASRPRNIELQASRDFRALSSQAQQLYDEGKLYGRHSNRPAGADACRAHSRRGASQHAYDRQHTGGVLPDGGRYGEAEPLHLRALEARERVLGKEHRDTLTSVNDLAMLYDEQGRRGEAEPLYLRALKGSKRVLGKEHPETLTVVNNLAMLYKNQGRYGWAEPLLKSVLKARERVLGKNHSATLASVNNLAELFRAQGRGQEAEPLYLRALKGSERVLGKEHPQTVTIANNLAELRKAQEGRQGKD